MNFFKRNLLLKAIVLVYAVFLFFLTMMSSITDWAVYFRFCLTLSCFMVYFLFLSFKQLQEVIRPVNWLTPLRWLILATLALTTVSFVPSIIYQYYLSIGQKYELLRQVSTVMGGINLAGTTFFLVLIYTYKKQS